MFSKAPGLESHHQIHFSVIPGTLVVDVQSVYFTAPADRIKYSAEAVCYYKDGLKSSIT